jgi:hypothetical protein
MDVQVQSQTFEQGREMVKTPQPLWHRSWPQLDYVRGALFSQKEDSKDLSFGFE